MTKTSAFGIRRSRRYPCGLLIAVLLWASAGCGSDARVSGRITLDGEPVGRGTVIFQAQGQPMCTGVIDENGSYEMKTGDTKGMPPAKYDVTIACQELMPQENPMMPPPTRLVTPAKYANRATSGLVADVQRGRNTFDFDLQNDVRK